MAFVDPSVATRKQAEKQAQTSRQATLPGAFPNLIRNCQLLMPLTWAGRPVFSAPTILSACMTDGSPVSLSVSVSWSFSKVGRRAGGA